MIDVADRTCFGVLLVLVVLKLVFELFIWLSKADFK